MRLTHSIACSRDAATSRQRIAADRLPRNGIASARALRLRLALSLPDRLRRDEDHHRVRIVFGLRDQVGREKLRIAAVAVDHGFGRPGQHVDGAIEAHQLLGCGDKDVSRARRSCPRAGWSPFHRPAPRWPALRRSDKLRESPADAAAASVAGCGRGETTRCAPHPRPARESRSSAAWREADSVRRAHSSRPMPADAQSVPVRRRRSSCAMRAASAIGRSAGCWRRRVRKAFACLGRSRAPGFVDLLLRNPQRLAFLQAIPQCGIAHQRLVAAAPHRLNDLAHPGLDLLQPRRPGLQRLRPRSPRLCPAGSRITSPPCSADTRRCPARWPP